MKILDIYMNKNKYIIIGLMLIAGISSAWAQKVVIGNYIFPKDKATYYGELEGGKPHGKGKTTFKSGDTYEGEYVK